VTSPTVEILVPSDESHRGSYAGIVTRSVAFVTDAMLVIVAWTVGIFVAQSLAELFNIGNGQIESAFEALVASVAALVTFFLYYSLCLAIFGKTIGMMLLGLRVVRVDGRKPGPIRAGVRTLAFVVSSILMLGFLWISIDNRRQGWHDKIARTFVVYDWDLRAGQPLRARLGEPLVPHA
jgi:uncharacterized RDD family membrane protein YckC